MAKKNKFSVERVAKEEAEQELSKLRSGRGGRVSKYAPIADNAEDLKKGESLKVELKKNEVGGLRGYLQRRFGEKFTVKSSRLEGEDYKAFIFHTDDVEE